MTRPLLVTLAEWKADTWLKLVAAVLLLPLLVATLLGDAVLAVLTGLRRAWILRQTVAFCAAGHRVGLVAAWECRCGLVYEGSAWAACPNCGEVTHAVLCPCGRPVENPMSPVRE